MAEVGVLLGARWQMELLFKVWKRHGGVDRWRDRRALRGALSLSMPGRVVELLAVLRQRLQRRCPVHEGGKRPSTWQRLLAADAFASAATDKPADVTGVMAA